MAGDGKSELIIPLQNGDTERPFVLAWVEKAAVDKIMATNLTFSEKVAGLEPSNIVPAEKVETTGGPPEAADTTISF